MRHVAAALLLAALTAGSIGNSGNGLFSKFVAGPTIPDNVTLLEPGVDLEQRAQEALINADPGDVIEFPAGNFECIDELSFSAVLTYLLIELHQK